MMAPIALTLVLVMLPSQILEMLPVSLELYYQHLSQRKECTKKVNFSPRGGNFFCIKYRQTGRQTGRQIAALKGETARGHNYQLAKYRIT